MKDINITKDLEQNDKGHLLYSNQLEKSIKNLSNPHFLGSIHLKNSNFVKFKSQNQIQNLLSGELELNVNKSLKNMLFNPITKILVLLMISFNLLWFLFLYFF